MTTLMEPKAPAGLPDDAGRGDVKTSRLARWRASWRVALRMARRDVRRHKGRSLLVFLMVAIPVGLLAGAATVGATEQADAGDLITARMGSGQALVQGPQAGKIQQTPDPNQGGTGWSDDNPAVAIPGFSADAAATDNSSAISRLVGGGTAVAVGQTEMRLVVGERRVRVSGLVLDARVADLGEKARLSSGAWGKTPDEIVITPAGERKGLPRSGSVTLSAGGTERSVQVVGTASALLEWGGMPDFVVPSLPHGAGADSAGIGAAGSWVLVGGGPVTWADVQRLNTYGLTVYSRAVLEDPPPESALPPELRPQDNFAQDTGRMIAVIGGVMLFILTTLLVGPAFAVSATRQRRTLALAATNGAETRQLRRTVLAQALVLGVISALGGVVLGTLAVRAGLWWWVSTHPESSFASIGLDIPWGAYAILVPCAVLSAVVAALLPSLRLGRLDIIGVMRGQSVSPRLNKVVPVVGLLLAVAGGAVVLSAARMQAGGDFRVATGAVALVLGTLLLVPAILVAFGALGARFPVAPRIAIRDAARHRSRSTPTVAAILAGVVALTAFSIGLASDTKQQMATYQPQALPGEGTISTGDAETQLSVDAALRHLGGAVRTTPLLIARGAADPFGPTAANSRSPQPFVAAVPERCTVQNALDHSGPEGVCSALGTLSYDTGQIGVLPAREITARLGLSAGQRRVIDEGGIAVAAPALAKATTLAVAHGTFVMDQSTYVPTDVVTTATARLPVVAVAATGRTGAMPAQTGAFVTPETAKRLGWPTFQTMVLLRAPDGGAIDEATEKQLDELIGDESELYVERGFQRYDEKVMKIMMGVAALLLLIVTLISTALSMAEQQADSGTLAAVGATRRTRRAFAAAQAMVVGFIGAVLGIAVGLVPGIAITYPLTRSYDYDPGTGVDHVTGPYLAIPWTPLLLVVLGVPVLAGLLSALAIRRAPAMTRRAD
jgi:putative ABC transport system permease protein